MAGKQSSTKEAQASLAEASSTKGGEASLARASSSKGDEAPPLSRAELASVAYKLKRAPAEVKQKYDELRPQKVCKSTEKREFMLAVLNTDNFDEPVFERCKKQVSLHRDASEKKWISWTQLVKAEGLVAARLMVVQRKVLTRPHDKLDHSDPRTSTLPSEQQLQYQYMEETETIENR